MLFRTFMRGFFRSIAKRLARRAIARSAVRGIGRPLSSRSSGNPLESGKANTVKKNLEESIDIMEALELAQELPSIEADARQAAIQAANETFMAVYEQMNPGQKVLTEEYCLPAADEYFSTTNDPNPDDYLNAIFSVHEAIEQALSFTVEQSWEAASQSALQVILSRIFAIIGEAIFGRISKRINESPWERWERESLWGGVSAGQIRAMDRFGNMPGTGDMYIGRPGSGGSQFGAERQLSWGQFASRESQPYWHTESNRVFWGKALGEIDISDAEYRSYRDDLYRATYADPYSTEPPPGWRQRY